MDFKTRYERKVAQKNKLTFITNLNAINVDADEDAILNHSIGAGPKYYVQSAHNSNPAMEDPNTTALRQRVNEKLINTSLAQIHQDVEFLAHGRSDNEKRIRHNIKLLKEQREWNRSARPQIHDNKRKISLITEAMKKEHNELQKERVLRKKTGVALKRMIDTNKQKTNDEMKRVESNCNVRMDNLKNELKNTANNIGNQINSRCNSKINSFLESANKVLQNDLNKRANQNKENNERVNLELKRLKTKQKDNKNELNKLVSLVLELQRNVRQMERNEVKNKINDLARSMKVIGVDFNSLAVGDDLVPNGDDLFDGIDNMDDLNLSAFGDEESDVNETKNALETMNKWKKNKKVKNDQFDLTMSENEKSSKMMNVIRSNSKSSKKRKHGQMDDYENENEIYKKRRMSQESKERELRKRIRKIKENKSVNEEDERDCAKSKFMNERERYLMKTRMSKNERKKNTAQKLNEFGQIIEKVKNEKNVNRTNKGKKKYKNMKKQRHDKFQNQHTQRKNRNTNYHKSRGGNKEMKTPDVVAALIDLVKNLSKLKTKPLHPDEWEKRSFEYLQFSAWSLIEYFWGCQFIRVHAKQCWNPGLNNKQTISVRDELAYIEAIEGLSGEARIPPMPYNTKIQHPKAREFVIFKSTKKPRDRGSKKWSVGSERGVMTHKQNSIIAVDAIAFDCIFSKSYTTLTKEAKIMPICRILTKYHSNVTEISTEQLTSTPNNQEKNGVYLADVYAWLIDNQQKKKERNDS